MSAYRSTGAFDDNILDDGDRGFVSVNQRLQLNQLQPGEVRESLNGRMEGYWKPRKGIVEKTSAFTTGSSPLALPFYLMDSPKTISGVSVPSTGTIRITVTGHGFEEGSQGWARISDLDSDVNGDHLLTYVDVDTLQYTVAGVTSGDITDTSGTLEQMPISDSASANVRASCIFSDPNSNNKEYVIIALDTMAKKVDLADYSTTDIQYPPGQAIGAKTDMIQVFDKVMLFRDGQQAFEWYPHGRPIVDASQSGTTTVTMEVRNHGLLEGATINITGLTGTTPPNGTFTVASVLDADNFTYVATNSPSTSFGVTDAVMSDGFTLSPGGGYTQPQVFNSNGLEISALNSLITLSVNGNTTLSAGDTVRIYESTIPEFESIVGSDYVLSSATSSELSFYAPVPNYTRDIVSASQTDTIVTANVKGHNFSVGDSISVAGLTGVYGGTIPNGTQTVTSVSGDNFTYTATAALTYYSLPNPKTITNVTVPTTGTVEITITAHGLNDGWGTLSGLNTIINGSWSFTKHSSDALRFSVPGITSGQITDISGTLSQMAYSFTTTVATAQKPTRSSQQIEVGGRFSVGGGFIHQPGSPWGVHFQRRLWVPYYYDVGGTYSSPTYTNRKITDEIAASDILDTTTFDSIYNQFRISGGTADHVVAMHGFYNDGLIVLNRNSIHIVTGTQGTLNDTVVKELTSEVGCLARKSVVMRGNAMLFLSDDGVYGLEFLDEYNLRGADEPISKNIQPYIDRINKDYADRAVGILYENRYYLAIPLDSYVGANDARGNNAILVFNFLNQGWESLDTFGDGRFLIEDFVVGSADIRNNLYAVTSNGGLHQLESEESSNDRFNVSNTGGIVVTTPIDSKLVTRGYDFQTMDRKRFTDAQINMQCLLGQSGEYEIEFAAEDPDSAETIGTTTQFLGLNEPLQPNSTNEAETASIRCRLGGIRGYTGTIILTRNVGSPKINSVKVSGSITNRQILSQR